MAIRMMCAKECDGAELDAHWSREAKSEIWIKTSHVGLVLQTVEQNGYHDSDFFAIVWNDEKGEPERIEYASTRGWSYPNSAGVDATPEVLAKHEAWQTKMRDAARASRQRCEAATPTKGKTVQIVRGKNAGETGTVFWYGAAREFGPMYRNGWKAAAATSQRLFENLLPPSGGLKQGRRVGLMTHAGEKIFCDATYVNVV